MADYVMDVVPIRNRIPVRNVKALWSWFGSGRLGREGQQGTRSRIFKRV